MHTLFIDGLAFWSPAYPGWPQWQAAVQSPERGTPNSAVSPAVSPAVSLTASPRPSPTLLAANERRRAPDTVLLALEVAQAAVAMSGHNAAQLASVFTSAHGDLPTTDALCATLAANPLLLSPTRFHHSVHNAASGYWAIASGSRAASTALSANSHSFAAGLLEAASLCAANHQGVLLVAYDTQAVGPLASVNTSQGLLAVAMVLASAQGPSSQWALQWRLGSADGSVDDSADGPNHTPPLGTAAQTLAGNAMAGALPLFEALAKGQATRLPLPLGAGPALMLHLAPVVAPLSAPVSAPVFAPPGVTG